MQAAAGSVSWVAPQPSVLGRCGGGAVSASVKGREAAGVLVVVEEARGSAGSAWCGAARAQEKRPPRVRKSKEEMREMVESFINRI